MALIKTQSIRSFNKIDHVHYFIEAVRNKDYKYICRHFLWHLNNESNQPTTVKSIRSTITELTKDFEIDSQIIANTLYQMGKNGEIERIAKAHNKVRWNDELTNRIQWTNYVSEYKGKAVPKYEPAEQKIFDKLMAKYKNKLTPRNFEDMQNTMQLKKDQEMDALKEIMHEQSKALAELKILMLAVLNKEPLAEEKAKRHLSLVPDAD